MNKNIRIAIVGFGLIGQQHALVFAKSDQVELAAIVEPNAANKGKAQKYGVPIYDDLEGLFKEGQVDGVVLATPTPLHVEQALYCIENGCPVLIEKPIAVDAEQALEITKASQGQNVPVLVGHHRRHNAMVRAAKAALETGVVGAIRSVQATCWMYKPDTYFDEADWRKQKGAGPISVNLVHDVDLLRHFCGEVTKVHAVAVPSVRGYENEDLASAILTFASGCVATISVSDSIAAPWSWELTTGENPVYPKTDQSCYLIGGSEGALSIPNLDLWKHDPLPDWWADMESDKIPFEANDPLLDQMEHFGHVIRGDAQPLVSAEEGAKSLKVVEAIAKAAASGVAITVEPNASKDINEKSIRRVI